MRAMGYMIVLIWCLYGIPAEQWHVMTDMQQEVALDDMADETMQVLHCDEAEMTVIVEGKWAFIYGECIEGKYIAYRKESDTLSKRYAKEGSV